MRAQLSFPYHMCDMGYCHSWNAEAEGRIQLPSNKPDIKHMPKCKTVLLFSLCFFEKYILLHKYIFFMSAYKGFINVKSSIFINLFIYLFFGCVGSSLLHAGFLQLRRAGATLCCGARASHCGGFSCCGAQALGTRASQLWHAGSVVVARGLWSAGSVVVVHGLSCSVACGIFLDQGLNLCPLHWQADS